MIVVEVFILFLGSGKFPLSTSFTMVFAQVAVLADSMGVLRAINMRTVGGELLSTHGMVTILTHALCVERSFDMGTLCDLTLGYFGSTSLLALLRLPLLARLSGLLSHLVILAMTLLSLASRW
jgi:hypothetical protein